MNSQRILRWFASFVVLCLLVPSAGATLTKAQQEQILNRARAAYYRLPAHGFIGAQCDVRPVWQVMLNQKISDPVQRENAAKKLSGLHFPMSLDGAGNATLTHQWTPEPPADEQSNQAYQQIYGGMTQATSGFFQTWSMFMMQSPFPAPEESYVLEESGDGYRLSFSDPSTNVIMILSKDMGIRRLEISTTEFSSVIEPVLNGTPEGFLVSGFSAEYRPKNATTGFVTVQTTIDYTKVEGVQLPSRLGVKTTYDGQPADIDLELAEWRLTKR